MCSLAEDSVWQQPNVGSESLQIISTDSPAFRSKASTPAIGAFSRMIVYDGLDEVFYLEFCALGE